MLIGLWMALLGIELRQGHDIVFHRPNFSVNPLITYSAKPALSWASGTALYQDIFVGRRIGALVSKRIAHSDCDVVLTNDYAIAAYSKLSNHWYSIPTRFSRRITGKTNIRGWPTLSPVSVAFCQHIHDRG